MPRLCLSSIAISCLTLLLAACIPPQMHVTDGTRPGYSDKHVRFRTTYYFRVFDACYSPASDGFSQPRTDSLYRFVMTGKANPMLSSVRFESGTLKASQIDPFGATVKFDSESGTYRFVSPDETSRLARRSETIEQLDTLIELKSRLLRLNQSMEGTADGSLVDSAALASVDAQIKGLISEYGSPNPPGTSNVSPATSIGAKSNGGAKTDPVRTMNCPPGSRVQRGFQIMGPQGLKTYDQEDRLILAMSSEAEPLISSLEQISGRVLQARSEKMQSSDLLLALAKEQLIVADIDLVLLKDSDDDSFEELYAELETALGGGE